VRLGRKRIATITGPQTRIGGIDRYDGYMDALRERGFSCNPELVAEGDFTDAGGYFAMQKLMPHKPDAVFAASDTMAIGAMRAIQEAGLRIPEDIAMIGYDDIPMAARTSPQLTTVRQPIQREGGMAAETLIDMIAHPGEQARRIILTSELVIRSSCSTAVL
jgi:LacI family transcriptional regulator